MPIIVVVVVVRRRLGSRISNWRGVRVHAYKMLMERILMAPGQPPRKLVVVVDSSSPGADENVRTDIELGLRSARVQVGRTFISVGFADSKSQPLIQVAGFYAYLYREIEMHRYKLQRGKYIIDLEGPLLRARPKLRRCPGSSRVEGCGVKIWVI